MAFLSLLACVAGAATVTIDGARTYQTIEGFGVNAKSPDGRVLLHELAARSDLVIENNSTGTMDKLGIGFDALHVVNPGLVMVSSQLMGSHGAWSWWRGYGPSTQPPGGLVHLWAENGTLLGTASQSTIVRVHEPVDDAPLTELEGSLDRDAELHKG